MVRSLLKAPSSPESAAPEKPFQSPEYQRVLFAGDSLTVGRDADKLPQSFRELVAGELRAEGTSSVTTIAKSGARLNYIAQSKKLPSDLDLAIVELGTNDIRWQTPIKEFKIQYQKYLAKINASSPEVKLICLGVWHDPKAKITQSLDLVIKSVCLEHSGSYVQISDLFARASNRGPAGRATWNVKSDAFHPNNAGHQAIAAKLLHELHDKSK
ncbi:SGNH/GDSL hydrolase family protein [Glutamicibacter sp. JC586]|uniref:SGNH/GDSL hydrolase family protein n=1 Tax=Glutamicibacter sp. JC586 TaxID=2590552 RepID=UPI001357DB33|nr:SGNH/GDSL hydrolase family protein [Glutamicibacter sp. JC586]